MITLHWFQPQELIEIMKLVTSTLNETYAPNFFVETYNSGEFKVSDLGVTYSIIEN